MVSFKEGFTRARKSTGLSRTAWAEKNHYSTETVKKWETGKAVPREDTLIELCDIFQCDMGYLFNQYDCKTRDLQFIYDEIGLSEKAVKKLKSLKLSNRKTAFSDIISTLLLDSNCDYFLSVLGGIMSYSLHNFKEEPKFSCSVNADGSFSEIADYSGCSMTEIDLDGIPFCVQKENLLESVLQSNFFQAIPRICKLYGEIYSLSPLQKHNEYKSFIMPVRRKLWSEEITESEYHEIEKCWLNGAE